MTRAQEPSSQARRAVGIILALGAAFGALVGAGVGAVLGDIGSWIGFGIPVGISIALAVGAFLAEPARVASSTSWMMEDDAIPMEPPAQTQDKREPGRSTTEAA